MKSLTWRFVTDESGDIDGLTIFCLTIGFIAAFAMLNGTFGQLFANIASMFSAH